MWPFAVLLISPTQQFHFSQSPCISSPKRQSFAELSLLWEAQAAGLARVDRSGHDPTTGTLPPPLWPQQSSGQAAPPGLGGGGLQAIARLNSL